MRYRNTFFTSDWHIGHANVIKYSNRPFKDVDHMHRVLINNYNSVVKEDDVCYFLGDVGMTKSDVLKSIISELNGLKILILGNHDKGTNKFLDAGFDVVMNGAILIIANERVTLSHCPLYGIYREDTTNMMGGTTNENWHGESRIGRKELFSFTDEGQFHLHGHIHSPNNGRSQKILDRQYDVGVDANKYRPVSASEIESWIVTTLRK